MRSRQQRGDIRTWLLLVLALVPTWSVLAGAGWLWSERGDEIADFEDALLPVDTTYELFVVTSQLFRAEASLRVAGLPDASDEVIDRAARDQAAALFALQNANSVLVPLIDGLDPERDIVTESDVLELLGGSVDLGIELFENQVPGEPLDPQIAFLVAFARDTAAGLVLPFVDSGSREAFYFYDALGTTVEYHDQFDRDRARIVAGFATSIEPDVSVVASALREAEWNDVIDSRSFVPLTANVAWFGTTADPEAPLLLETAEPLATLIMGFEEMSSSSQRDQFFLELQQIDDALEADVDLAYSELARETNTYLSTLITERRLTAITSTLMAFLGLALALLTISEVRRRRRVEVAHGDAMDQLGEKAYRDPTTGVWNRRRLESAVLEMIAAAPAQNETIVLAYLDLDHFKAINDVWGHGTGDQVLRRVTERLDGFSFDSVEFELCRFGGDEFVLYAQMKPKPLDWLEQLGETLIDAVDSDMDVNGRRHEVGVSVGIATSNSDSTLDSLLLEADSSLILAKQERGTAVVYNRDISRTGELVHALPSALTNGEVCAHIQPVVNAKTGEVVHVEALARWRRQSGEEVSPGVFVPLVESYGLAEQLTTTVLGCVQSLIQDPDTPETVRVWINVSPRELDVANFAERFVSILRQLGVPPTRIGLEITETAAVRDPDRLAIELRRLREVGIAVAIDDFGNGYSPLGYLRHLPVDIVKIDRSLISNIHQDVANQHIVIGIVGLVHELGMGIVAEGIERTEEAHWLIDHGVTRVQGFLFDRPTCPSEFSWQNREGAAIATLHPGS